VTKPTITAIQERAWQNKIRKGFNTTDVPLEFALAFTELGEAFDAWRRTPETLPGELADVLIYLVSIAQMAGIDLEAAVIGKLAANEQRTYTRNSRGHLVKAAAEQAGDAA
jgi:NTP pyrophosphatase (non-canonical NTP hydrolase)